MAKYVPLIVVAVVVAITGAALYVGSHHVDSGSATGTPPTTGAPAGLAKAVEPAAAPKGPAGMNLEGGKIEQRDPEGQLEWSVTARGDLEFDKDNQRITGRNVRFEMANRAKMPCILDAPVFHADYESKVLTFDQGVTGRMTTSAASFRVNHVVFDFNSQKLVGTGGARFAQGKYLATAREIVVDPKAKKVRLRGGVRFEKHN